MKQNNSLVSVIIPFHNRFEFTMQAIDSIAKQTYHPIELILVNDCSDTSFEISGLEKFFEGSLHLITLKSNMGPGFSREQGRNAASGEFVCYLDSDDLWHPAKVEKQVAMLRTHPKIGMCYCQSIEFEQLPIVGNEPIRKRSDEAFSSFLPTIFDGRPWDTSACLWTREATDKIGPWLNGWTWEDYEYDCRAGCSDIKIVHIPDVLCYYRRSNHFQQLSAQNYRDASINRIPSLLEMSRNLRLAGKLDSSEIRLPFLGILQKSIYALYSFDEISLARTCAKEMVLDTKPLSFIWVLLKIIYTTLPIFQKSIINRLLIGFARKVSLH